MCYRGICIEPIRCERSCDIHSDWPQECATLMRSICDIHAVHVYSTVAMESKFENSVENAARGMGYTAFCEKQKEAIPGTRRDVFLSLPTESGKSLCYSTLPKVLKALPLL